MSRAIYYVEVRRQSSDEVEEFAHAVTFEEAFDWLMAPHQARDTSLNLRLVTSVLLPLADEQMLRHFNVHLIES